MLEPFTPKASWDFLHFLFIYLFIGAIKPEKWSGQGLPPSQ